MHYVASKVSYPLLFPKPEIANIFFNSKNALCVENIYFKVFLKSVKVYKEMGKLNSELKIV